MRSRFWVAAFCCVSVSLFADPTVRNVVTIPIPLPKDFMPAAIPAHPIDNEVSVCLVLPSFTRDMNANWTTPVSWGESQPGQPPFSNVKEVDHVFVNFDDATATVLPKIVKRLFPRTEVLSSTVSSRCDLRLLFALRSKQISGADHALSGVTVTGILNATTPDNKLVAAIAAEGSGYRRKSMYWSTHTEARAISEPALHDMLEDLFRQLVSDSDLMAFVKEKAAERARPSDLETTAKFDDSASFFPNNKLDAGEQANLRLTIRNRGAGPAFGVRLRMTTAAKGVAIPGEAEIGDMPPGGTKESVLNLAGALDLESSVQPLRVETLEKRGYGGRPLIIELPTAQLNKPALEIADVSLNGRPSNGDRVEATVLIRNGGPGDAVGAHVTISSIAGIEIAEPSADIPAIRAQAVGEARFVLRLPVTFAGTDLPLTLHVSEARGEQVAHASRTASWPVELKRPAVEVTVRMYDGNSPDSRGDRDGVANNGETLELALTPVNRGGLTARDVAVSIVSRQPGVMVTPDVFQTGELPPFSEGAEHRVRVVLPRTLGRDAMIDKLPLAAAIALRDFPSSEQPISLPFKARHPELVATITAQSPLVEGSPAAFALQVRNRGALPAENVRVEVSCDNSGLELLDISGTPARTLVIDLGAVAAQTAAPPIAIKAQVRRNLPTTATSLAVVVQQADFAPATTQSALDIQREEVDVVRAPVPAPEPAQRAADHVAAAPATISFQRYENGEQVNEETIALRFEVQSRSALKTVRVEQNHRVLDLADARVFQDPASKAWQYAPRVHLDYGENVFNVVVVTAEGIDSSRSITLHRERPLNRVWVAAIGISKYANKGVPDLDFARDDAAAVVAYYKQFGVPDEQIIRLFDEQATLTNIKRSLGSELARKATNRDDTVILYFAGHGEREADNASMDSDGYTKYLLTYDTNPSDLFSSALSMDELSQIVRRLAPERVVLIIDSCFSGAAGGRTPFEGGVKGRAPISDEFLTRMAASGKGTVILTASSPQEVAQERTELHHGVFTYYLLEALRGAADTDHDGRVDIDEIYKFVTQKVADATNRRQTPMKKANLTGTVVIGKRIEP